jgi:hypothetical protein
MFGHPNLVVGWDDGFWLPSHSNVMVHDTPAGTLSTSSLDIYQVKTVPLGYFASIVYLTQPLSVDAHDSHSMEKYLTLHS